MHICIITRIRCFATCEGVTSVSYACVHVRMYVRPHEWMISFVCILMYVWCIRMYSMICNRWTFNIFCDIRTNLCVYGQIKVLHMCTCEFVCVWERVCVCVCKCVCVRTRARDPGLIERHAYVHIHSHNKCVYIIYTTPPPPPSHHHTHKQKIAHKYTPTHPPNHPLTHPPIHLPTHQPTHSLTHPPTHPNVYTYICVCVCLCVCVRVCACIHTHIGSIACLGKIQVLAWSRGKIRT